VGLKHKSIALGVVAVAALATAAALASGTATAASGRAHQTRVAPIPAVTDHVLAKTLSFPPDTAYCRAQLGISCYSPLQYQQAYDLKPLYAAGINGSKRTIGIVDAFGSPTIANDLHVFDQTYGLPDPPSLKVVQPAGAVPAFDPANSDMTGWATETTLDVEYAHAIAPGANIVLAETPVAETEGVTGFPEIVRAENYLIDHKLADVITQSFGATENTFPSTRSLLDLRSAVVNAHKHKVTMLGSSGDDGATDAMANGTDLYPYPVNSWPSSDPLVTSVGGTQLHLDAQGNRTAPDETWNDGYGASGGGLSQVFSRPAFQDPVRSVVGSHRGTPDISMSAAVDGGAILYYSFKPTTVGWHIVGGTSEASPLFAGIVALTDQRARGRIGDINEILYRLPVLHHFGIVDVTIGNNSFAGVTGYPATRGYDLSTGWGTVDAAKFVPVLAAAAALTG
jgi:subtilase family serine protease